MMLSIFSYAHWPLSFFFEKKKMSIQILYPFLKLDVFVLSFFYIFGYYPLIRYIICKYHLSFSTLPFYFVDCFLHCAQAFEFNIVTFVYFSFCWHCFWSQIQKISPRTMSRSLPWVKCLKISIKNAYSSKYWYHSI